jgi:hypothetical protein
VSEAFWVAIDLQAKPIRAEEGTRRLTMKAMYSNKVYTPVAREGGQP